MIELTVNGTPHQLDLDPSMPLLWALREHLGLTGTKYGCGIGQCGACTVHLDGEAVRSCSIPLAAAAGRQITTIEGLVSPEGTAVKAAWEALDVVQCGFCQPGQIMSAAALLSTVRDPSDADIDRGMTGNLCRCATYARIRAAIRRAAGGLA
jgi:isoquinoline 1-oxidoreductase alpha subunit